MDMEIWKVIWGIVFILASVGFYVTILYVAVRGFGDVVAMIRRILSGERDRPD